MKVNYLHAMQEMHRRCKIYLHMVQVYVSLLHCQTFHLKERMPLVFSLQHHVEEMLGKNHDMLARLLTQN